MDYCKDCVHNQPQGLPDHLGFHYKFLCAATGRTCPATWGDSPKPEYCPGKEKEEKKEYPHLIITRGPRIVRI
jgi:hypothetical protein